MTRIGHVYVRSQINRRRDSTIGGITQGTMIITKTKCHMLSLLILLTDQDYVSDTFMPRSNIVDLTSIPAGYVPEVTKQLSEKGLVKTKRGKDGGTTLALDPDRFRLSELFERLELFAYPNSCSSTPDYFSECAVKTWGKQFEQTMDLEQSLSEFTESLSKTRDPQPITGTYQI